MSPQDSQVTLSQEDPTADPAANMDPPTAVRLLQQNLPGNRIKAWSAIAQQVPELRQEIAKYIQQIKLITGRRKERRVRALLPERASGPAAKAITTKNCPCGYPLPHWSGRKARGPHEQQVWSRHGAWLRQHRLMRKFWQVVGTDPLVRRNYMARALAASNAVRHATWLEALGPRIVAAHGGPAGAVRYFRSLSNRQQRKILNSRRLKLGLVSEIKPYG